jgi:hypothetical protein
MPTYFVERADDMVDEGCLVGKEEAAISVKKCLIGL